MPDIDTRLEHQWQGITLENVQVLTDDDGDPVIIGEGDPVSQYGCSICGEAMTTHLHTECSGELVQD